MKVPFVDLKTQYNSIKKEILDEINDVLENTAFVCGKKVKKFEDDFAKSHDVKFCIGLSSGTDALHTALQAVNIKPGDEVIVPVNTFIATSESVTLCGGRPVFVDHDERTYNIDANKIEKAITNRTKAIIPVHLYGQPAEMDSIMKISKEHGLAVIEDCSQAHFSEYKGRKIGGFGDIGTFSFYPGKNLGAYGEAGAVVTNNEKLFSSMLRFRQHGSIDKYIHDIEGHNYRMEEIQGAVLNVKLRYISGWTKKRQRIAGIYGKMLSGIADGRLKIPEHPGYISPVYHLYVVRSDKREELSKFLSEKGISTALHYPIPLHLQKAYDYLGHKEGDFPVAEKCCSEILSLPMFPEMSDEQVHYVCESIKQFYTVN